MSSDDSYVMSSDMNSFTGHVLDHVLTDPPKIIELKRKRDLVLYSSSDCEESVSDDFVPKLPTIGFATLNNSTPNTLYSDYDSISSNEDDDDAENPGTTTNPEVTHVILQVSRKQRGPLESIFGNFIIHT